MIAAIDPADVVWVAVALAIMIALALVAWVTVRKKFGSPNRPYQQNKVPFTLKELDKMLYNGEISKQEHTALRDHIVKISRASCSHLPQPSDARFALQTL